MIQESIPALRRERLSWVRQNFIRVDTLSAGRAILVAAHDALPLVAHWGAGDVASVDGMRFIAPVSTIHAGPDPKYFGQGRGLTWNNMLSNHSAASTAWWFPAPCAIASYCLPSCSSNRPSLNPWKS